MSQPEAERSTYNWAAGNLALMVFGAAVAVAALVWLATTAYAVDRLIGALVLALALLELIRYGRYLSIRLVLHTDRLESQTIISHEVIPYVDVTTIVTSGPAWVGRTSIQAADGSRVWIVPRTSREGLAIRELLYRHCPDARHVQRWRSGP